MSLLEDHPHRRLNRLTGEYVLVSPHRGKRPWQGEQSAPANSQRPAHDPACHLCPGNTRSGGQVNPDYPATFVFANDFPALLDEPVTASPTSDALFQAEPASGEARVICFAPDHSLTLARMDDGARRRVVDTWCDLSAELGARWNHVQLFENKGAMMGASSPHPHGQVWASDFVPEIVSREDRCQRAHQADFGASLLHQTVEAELAEGTRLIEVNEDWAVFVPFWAAWPYETLLVTRQEVARLEQLDERSRENLAAILGKLLRRYDALFATDFPYSMGWHGAPHGLGADTSHWRLHAHFFPPLLRSATVRKHMVGFELLAETQRDLTPEAAAWRLREVQP